MKSIRIFAASITIIAACSTHSSAQSFSCAKDGSVSVGNASADPVKIRRLGAGDDPCISPDGTQIAFTQSDADGNRFIAVMDSKTGKSRRVDGIPGKNSYLPIWSPDGKSLYFNHFHGDNWVLAKVSPKGGDFQAFTGLKRQPASYGWMPDGSALVCHDLNAFYLMKIKADGSPGAITDLPASLNALDMSSGCRISVTKDGKSALVDATVGEDMTENDPGPPSAIFLIALDSGKVTRLTPKGIDASYPAWLPDGSHFLFSSADKNGNPVIKKSSTQPGATPEILVKNAGIPTVAAGE